MKTNVELEFISKVRDLSEEIRNLANFGQSNLEALEKLNVGKKYPFNESLQDLAFNVFDWFVALNNEYYRNLQK